MRATGEERALARSAIYRLLGLAFSYPAREVVADLERAVEVAEVAGRVIDTSVTEAVEHLKVDLDRSDSRQLEAQYQRIFTLSYSEECPLYETAFSARHLFQQTQQQADISGFYRAFGVEPHGERPDHLAAELEFAYLLALKEAKGYRDADRDHREISRAGLRSFLADHLVRWGALIGRRVAVVGAGTFYATASHLLLAFLESEAKHLRLGPIEPFRDEPVLISDEPGDLTCPITESLVQEMMERIEGENRVEV